MFQKTEILIIFIVFTLLLFSGPQVMQRNNLSPRYSTRLQDIITVKS
jgi:hypothetical protein